MPDDEPIVIPQRQIKAATDQATYLRNKILNSYDSIRNWRDVEEVYGIEIKALIPPNFQLSDAFWAARPSQFQLDNMLGKYIADTPARLIRAEQAARENAKRKVVRRLAPEADCYRFHLRPDIALYPEQHPVFTDIYDILFNGKKLEPHQPNPRALLQNGITGSGKTVVACAVIDRFIAEGKHLPTADFPLPLPFPILWITVGNAVVQTERSLEDVGLGHLLGTVIHVISYDELSTETGQGRFCQTLKEPDPFDPETIVTTYKWKASACPRFLILDEAHSVQNTDARRTKILQAMDETERVLRNPLSGNPLINMRALYLTATPVERVSDARMFVCMTDLIYQGQRITYENFNTSFANLVAEGNPDKVTAIASERLFSVLKHRVIELPRCKWKHKAINSCRFYDFLMPTARQHYQASWERHQERCEKMGKDPEAGAEYTSLIIFAREVEPIRADNIIPEMYDNVRQGRTSVMATRFTGSIIKSVFLLMDSYGVSRDEISIIWGGRKNIKPDRILTQADLADILREYSDGIVPPEIMRLIKRNLEWQEDKLLFGDADEEKQDARYARLQALGLIGVQTKLKRQAEIDKFQSGRARYCFFTAQSGGTGLSLHHASDQTAQRYLWATPIYSGKEFTQMMGRCPRRPSWSDSIQYVCLMNGTVESEHVGPILDKKLQAAGKFTSQRTDLAMILAQERIRKADFADARKLSDRLRTQAQILADADNEDSQLYSPDRIEDDDND